MAYAAYGGPPPEVVAGIYGGSVAVLHTAGRVVLDGSPLIDTLISLDGGIGAGIGAIAGGYAGMKLMSDSNMWFPMLGGIAGSAVVPFAMSGNINTSGVIAVAAGTVGYYYFQRYRSQ